ncbi:MAG: 2-oxoacid:acceptor oxidoreductase family protein, partial [Acetivibrio sp.]
QTYRENIMETLKNQYETYAINAMEEAKKLGNTKVFNVIVLGMAAKHMDFSKESWMQVIEETVPEKTVEINKKAFLLGFEGAA